MREMNCLEGMREMNCLEGVRYGTNGGYTRRLQVRDCNLPLSELQLIHPAGLIPPPGCPAVTCFSLHSGTGQPVDLARQHFSPAVKWSGVGSGGTPATHLIGITRPGSLSLDLLKPDVPPAG